jgi:hypothetical protein
VAKKCEMSYAGKDGENIGGFSKSLWNFLHIGSHFCTTTNMALILPFDLSFRLLCLYDCN